MDINLESLQNAVRQLERTVEAYSNNPDTEFVRDALITRFTFTFAQAITTLGRYLYTVHCMSDGHIISPRQRIRHAARIGLINNCESWLRHAENRNRVEHAYSEPMADAITATAPAFAADARALLIAMEQGIADGG